MREELLFVVVPRLAAFCCLSALAMLYLFRRRAHRWKGSADDEVDSGDAISKCWRYSIGVVLVGHLLAFTFPGAVTLWDRDLLRLIVLEILGVTAGTLALLSLLFTAARRLGRGSSFDTVALTLILLEVVSGLTIAVRYRWASSWAEVTLTPYLHSLLGFSPSVVLVSRMPFVVRLHVFSAFAILAIGPLTRIAGSLTVSVQELAQLASTAVLRLCRPAWRTREQIVRE